MKFGFIPSEGGGLFQEALEEAVLAESLGFDSVWLEEHHSIPGHYWPSPIVVLSAIAARTTRIGLGTNVIVLPFYNPVRLAEDVAVLEGISANRFTLGVAMGYRPPEFELYDVALAGRGGRLEEQVSLLQALWTTTRVDHGGTHFRAVGSIEPRPSVKPPLWLGGWGPRTIERAATMADAWLPGPTADLERLTGLWSDHDAAVLRNGGNPSDRQRPLTREVVIAPTEAEAWRLAERHLLINYRDEYGGGWQHPLVGQADATPVDNLEALARDRFIIGNPERCIDQIRQYQDSLGTDLLICRLYFPGMPHEHIMAELRLLAEAVIPSFR